MRNADVDAGVPFLVTALAENGSADKAMDPLGVPPWQAVRWIRHACLGASRTHYEQLLHRDIKPANLFLTADGEALLGDFGIAALMDANGEAPCHGTPATRAPEVDAGGNTTIASDVYSLGATLFALLTGTYAKGSGLPLRDLAPHVSLGLAERVAKATATDPADRYPNPAAFAAALGALPASRRRWRRTDEHPGHAGCWRGEPTAQKLGVTVCLVPDGTRMKVLGQHQPSGRKISGACRPAAPQSQWARNLRAAIAAAN